MALNHALMIADIVHARQRPKKHAFRYGVYYLCFDLEDLGRLPCALLALNRWNLFSFYERDHGAGDGTSLDGWVRNVLYEWGLNEADGKIILLTLPRILGYVFNPVSFWFCLDKAGHLRAVLSEVCNTFRERHCYLSFHDDHRPISSDDWLRAEKVFHVSPFMDVKGYYLFRFAYRNEKIGVWIDHHNEEGLILQTSVVGQRHPLTSSNLLKCFLRYPLVTIKVISLIHFEAVRLFLKGVRYRPKPIPPVTEITR